MSLHNHNESSSFAVILRIQYTYKHEQFLFHRQAVFQALPQLKGEVVVSIAFETTLNAHTKLLLSPILHHAFHNEKAHPKLLSNLPNGF